MHVSGRRHEAEWRAWLEKEDIRKARGLTADPTLGDGTSPGKPPEPDDCYGCCSTHGINLDGNMDDSTLVDNNRPGNMVDSALVDNNRPGDEGRTAAQNQISSTQGIGISDVSLPKVSFRDTVVGRTKTGSVVSEIPELDVLIGDDNFRFEVQDGTPTIDFF
ncbi:hypothetical protein V6N11_034011 [Hibiscus sabdariffa]|uniref:Uncharacterized protein n=1 Tax=Hibiscus sabdariffa TaxID=183260 RepID=A0ABR2S1Q4_9ROSI